eukprot:comp6235_c0_seq1/m.2058 comp6235_c0_seq1/g.2058  ORF comp6235_c0_seq1/g.2058 comp6235_c0_seq1/m.2058 type:complete len:113 (+) comp6235_c0_seq1:570-908(+)
MLLTLATTIAKRMVARQANPYTMQSITHSVRSCPTCRALASIFSDVDHGRMKCSVLQFLLAGSERPDAPVLYGTQAPVNELNNKFKCAQPDDKVGGSRKTLDVNAKFPLPGR